MKEHQYEFIVREHHLDSLGHMNHASYFVLFEEARWDWIHQGGYGFERVQSEQKGPVILDLKIRFKRELKFRDKIQIKTKLIEANRKLTRVSQQMFNSEGESLTEMELVFGFMDLKARRLIPLTDEWMKAIS